MGRLWSSKSRSAGGKKQDKANKSILCEVVARMAMNFLKSEQQLAAKPDAWLIFLQKALKIFPQLSDNQSNKA